eukprot:scaffold75443_cov72-Attheya_sp.AAC.2
MGKLVLTGPDGNIQLGDEEIEMLVALCMNRDYMDFMHEHYGGEHIMSMQPFAMTVVPDKA